MATNRFSDIKQTYEALEKNLQQLESQEEIVDQQLMDAYIIKTSNRSNCKIGRVKKS